jgi:type II secretory pathway component PulF
MKEEVYNVIKRSLAMINAGKKLSDGLRTGRNIVPTIMIKIVEAGEQSGSLDKSLKEISEYLDYEVSSMLKTATSLLEPIMLIVVGISVGGMMVAIIAPMYGLISQVSSSL